MTFDSKRRCLRTLIAFLALLPCAAGASDVGAELRALVSQTPELNKVFSQATVYAISPNRAESTATFGNKRHAVVLFEEAKASSGQMFCHAALGRTERDAWSKRLLEAAGGDKALASLLAANQPARIRFKQVEYSTLRSWHGWSAAVCVVSEENIRVGEQSMPEVRQIRFLTYKLGKSLFEANKKNEALERFKALKLYPELYANGLLYIIAILQDSHPIIASRLRTEYVNLSLVSDPDALKVYIDTLEKAGLLKDLEKARHRCSTVDELCGQTIVLPE